MVTARKRRRKRIKPNIKDSINQKKRENFFIFDIIFVNDFKRNSPVSIACGAISPPISPTDLPTIEPRLAEIFKTEEIINYGFWVLAKKLRA